MTAEMLIASFAWTVLTVGVLCRKYRKLHISLMLLGIVTDVSLVLYLQLSREAVQTALSLSLPALRQAHIAFSTLALLLYAPVIYLGFALLMKPNLKIRSYHYRLAVITYAFRSLGFLFMFSMLES